jgi:hypothetical protein
MSGKFINTKVALMLLITLSPLAIADTSKSGWVYLYPEDQYQSETGITDNSEYTVHRRIERNASRILSCTFIPALAIYNYVTNSHCDQAEKLWRQISHWFSAENKDNGLCRIKSLSGNMLFFYDVTCPCL